eukprot:SAG11_NODE_3927_length_2144_cov_13.208802_3_plen_78_part_00
MNAPQQTTLATDAPNRDRVAENLRNLYVESGKSSEIGIVIPALHDDTFGFVLGISNGTIAPISTTVTLKSRLGQRPT